VKNKHQHVIPNCYLKSWCDPTTPAGQTPYIWRVSKDGTQKKNKSPEKSFTASNRYTITMPNGDRNLVIENTLGGIENQFVGVLGRVRRREHLTPRDRAHLCLFTAAMHTRSIAMGEHWKEFYQGVHNQVVALEKKRKAPPATSLETADLVKHAHPYLVQSGVEVLAPMLFKMPMSILVADDGVGFVTSDNPCVWNVPNAHRMPPGLRYPGLSQPGIEITLPLTPRHMLLISYRVYPLYVNVQQTTVDDANRLRCLDCTEEFVSWRGGTRPYWLDPGKEPDDAWEKTAEGAAALAEQEKYKKWEAEYQEVRKAVNTKASNENQV
jgi:Protein of unknown function (DUF4238)